MTAYIGIRGPNRELQLPIQSCNSYNSFDSCNSCLKVVILHDGDSIENTNYFAIFSKILFDNTDNNTVHIETIKKDPKKLKLNTKKVVPCRLAFQLVYDILMN